MIDKIKNLFILSLLLAIYFFGCQPTDVPEIGLRTIKEDIYFLASDSLKGREAGTESGKIAAEYIASRFEEIGLEPKGDEGFFQEFKFSPRTNPHEQVNASDTGKLITRNVIGYLDNRQETTVVIGAHYDHLGYGGSGSLYRGDEMIHNGADDNASGVGAMIFLAELLKNKNNANNYMFIAFGGEEKGLLGSNYYTKNPTIDLEDINYMINLDMVGRLDEENKLAINGVGTSPAWMDDIESIKIDSLNIVTSESGVGPSDHTSFYLHDIPVLHFFTGTHEDYHKPGDDPEKINYEGIVSISFFIDSLITRLNDDGELAFSKTQDQSRQTPKFTVTLGVVPDYLFDGTGMRIDGVSDGKPASIAGLQEGDVVIRLGDHEVTDMQSYMEGLSQFEKGDKTTVTVKRNDQEITEPIQF